MNEAYLYPYSAEYARQRGEESLWRASYLSNMDCKDAIRKAVWQHYDGAHLDGDCLAKVIQEFGYKRTAWVLANTIQQLEWGGQYSSENKEWASRIYIPPDKSHNLNFVVPIRSAVLNGVVDQYRAAYQALGLFSPNQCEPDSFEKLDYEGKVLVLSPDTLKESCWKPENQLWYAHDGFGCSPTAIGRSIRCTCLNDEEMARWNRTDFTGVLKEEFLPDWAREKLQELKLNKLQQMSRSEKEQALAMRINLAWDRYEMSLQTLSVSEVIDQIADVSAVWMCRDALLKDMELYSDEQLIFLLSLFDPLDQMRDKYLWLSGESGQETALRWVYIVGAGWKQPAFLRQWKRTGHPLVLRCQADGLTEQGAYILLETLPWEYDVLMRRTLEQREREAERIEYSHEQSSMQLNTRTYLPKAEQQVQSGPKIGGLGEMK